MSEPTDDGVLQANQAFYLALEGGDLDTMASTWSHGDDVVCAHPGRAALRGWDAIRRSWEAIFSAGGNPQVIITDEEMTRYGAVACVTLTENLLSAGQAGAASALNLFVFVDGRWRMVAHHAAPVLS